MVVPADSAGGLKVVSHQKEAENERREPRPTQQRRQQLHPRGPRAWQTQKPTGLRPKQARTSVPSSCCALLGPAARLPRQQRESTGGGSICTCHASALAPLSVDNSRRVRWPCCETSSFGPPSAACTRSQGFPAKKVSNRPLNDLQRLLRLLGLCTRQIEPPPPPPSPPSPPPPYLPSTSFFCAPPPLLSSPPRTVGYYYTTVPYIDRRGHVFWPPRRHHVITQRRKQTNPSALSLGQVQRAVLQYRAACCMDSLPPQAHSQPAVAQRPQTSHAASPHEAWRRSTSRAKDLLPSPHGSPSARLASSIRAFARSERSCIHYTTHCYYSPHAYGRSSKRMPALRHALPRLSVGEQGPRNDGDNDRLSACRVMQSRDIMNCIGLFIYRKSEECTTRPSLVCRYCIVQNPDQQWKAITRRGEWRNHDSTGPAGSTPTATTLPRARAAETSSKPLPSSPSSSVVVIDDSLAAKHAMYVRSRFGGLVGMPRPLHAPSHVEVGRRYLPCALRLLA
ncbi:hypothetical protein CERZMDRAFT_86361 [Cercospora zeae-maydis SCOH1-5]|uniref:Uncharacterized protein n=1 Tax=Cercospora zeae-maydis SCOH1-5 TaxID=717836 RepID=A0A6A6F9K4_9PEZI|nr:hypothetical protein CERZMDRAFT_86361 [Cercospora zeae-maydis SCOH1-5]